MCANRGVNVLLLLITKKALIPAVAAPLGWSARPNTECVYMNFS